MSWALENVSRRALLKGAVGAGALVLGARWLDPVAALAQEAVVFRPSLWLAIEPSGLVKIVAHRSEMGTGIRTTLPAVVADELEADWSRVELVQAQGDARWGDQNTDGSRSVRDSFQAMRKAGAAAREMLEAAAAQAWGVEPASCKAERHQVVHAESGRAIGYGELVERAAALQPPRSPRLKEPAEWRYVGKQVPLADGRAIVAGKATFGLDARLPGMRFAVVARSPVLGGALAKHDPALARAVPGVVDVVVIPPFQGPHAFQALGGVAVVAETTWAAIQGRRALEPSLEWAAAKHDGHDSAAYRDELLAAVREPGKTARKQGDVEAAFQGAAKVVEAEYTTPMLAHASMEPPCALASVSEAGCEVWAPTQNPQAARQTVAKALGIPERQVTVNVTLLGGGFGRKSKPDYVAEAALLSRAVKAPVQVVWTREDDLRHDYYHAPAALRMKASLDGEGKVTGWLQRAAFPSIGSTFMPVRHPSPPELSMGWVDLPFDVPNVQVEAAGAEAHVRIGWLRSVCNIFHAFAIGSFVDELARAAGKDPKAFLLELLGPDREVDLGRGTFFSNYGQKLKDHPVRSDRLRGVIERVASEAGWGRELPAGRGLGIAAHASFNSYVAVVVEAAVEGTKVSVPRVDIALDCGAVVNPDRVRAQMEGSVIFGLSLALMGKVSARDGAIVQSNFHDHPVLRMDEAPRQLGVHLVESAAPPTGVGEPGVPPVAPALANAIRAACGKRVRDLPIREWLPKAR